MLHCYEGFLFTCFIYLFIFFFGGVSIFKFSINSFYIQFASISQSCFIGNNNRNINILSDSVYIYIQLLNSVAAIEIFISDLGGLQILFS